MRVRVVWRRAAAVNDGVVFWGAVRIFLSWSVVVYSLCVESVEDLCGCVLDVPPRLLVFGMEGPSVLCVVRVGAPLWVFFLCHVVLRSSFTCWVREMGRPLGLRLECMVKEEVWAGFWGFSICLGPLVARCVAGRCGCFHFIISS